MEYIEYIDTIVGTLKIVSDEQCVIEVSKVEKKDKENSNALTSECKKQLEEYFDGKRENFDIPIKLNGTEFQKNVWKSLMEIPYGKTKSYKEIAESIYNPKSCRAVGNANNKNKILIIIPCHRVIGSNNKLVGFGLGLDAKEKLLNLEKV